jgi:outer membrane protein
MKSKIFAASLAVSLIVLCSAITSTALAAQQDESPWMMFIRVARLTTANDSSGLDIDVESKTIPDISFRYAFTKNIAAELLLTTPQKHEVSLAGVGNIGSFKHLPPTLFAQYHFMPDSDFRPYVGAGINYTIISDVKLLGGAAKLDNSSWGPAMQIGFDYKVGANSYVSVDLKKIYIESDVKVGGAKVASVKVDPVLFGIGYGFKF